MAKQKKGPSRRPDPPMEKQPGARGSFKGVVKGGVPAKTVGAPRFVVKPAHDSAATREYVVAPRKVRIESLGLEGPDVFTIVDRIAAGLDYGRFKVLEEETGVARDKILRIAHISARTLDRRRREGRFDPLESERLARFGRLFDHALELFEGDREAARRWLEEPKAALGGRSPFDLSQSEPGAREVEQLIARLEHGVFS